MNDTPQGDGNLLLKVLMLQKKLLKIRMNDTPQGDGNTTIVLSNILTSSIRMNDTPQGDGNAIIKIVYIFVNVLIRMNDTPQGDGNIVSFKDIKNFLLEK